MTRSIERPTVTTSRTTDLDQATRLRHQLADNLTTARHIRTPAVSYALHTVPATPSPPRYPSHLRTPTTSSPRAAATTAPYPHPGCRPTCSKPPASSQAIACWRSAPADTTPRSSPNSPVPPDWSPPSTSTGLSPTGPLASWPRRGATTSACSPRMPSTAYLKQVVDRCQAIASRDVQEPRRGEGQGKRNLLDGDHSHRGSPGQLPGVDRTPGRTSRWSTTRARSGEGPAD